ncbi:MAG TPA: DUF3604 domain-containing protein [Casimicrobiaceae bacterium]|nr:DUF3604 domain-containing protein [Casimicrobiaceae bacterium]
MNGMPQTKTGAEHPASDAIELRFDGERRLTAGSLARWTLHLTARRPMQAAARIAIAHRWPNDWGIAQGRDPAGRDYLDASTSDDGSVRWWSDRLPAWHPFDHVLFVELSDGLAQDRQLMLRYGDARKGSPGFTVQTFIEEASPFSLRWQPGIDEPWTEFGQLRFHIVGAEPERIFVTAPSHAIVDTPVEAHVRIEDRWGNPATFATRPSIEIVDPSDRDVVLARAEMAACAWIRVPITLSRTGVVRPEVRIVDARSLCATGNPIDVAGGPVEPLFWGDLHGQSIIGCGARSIDDYYTHARDFSACDFASHQANCFLVSNGEWRETEASTKRHHAPGDFVTFLGVEWSAASPLGGDHNLYFAGDTAELRRCSHEFVTDKSDAGTDLPHIADVYRHYRDSDTLVAVHVGGRTADLKWHEPSLDRLLEVHSTHATSDWFLLDALRRGYRMAVIAGSDGVDGRPGNSHPGHLSVRNVRGGLTAIAAPALTRDALWQALRERHCYATSGERILLEFRSGIARMGDAIAVPPFSRDDLAFDVRVEGTAPLEAIEFFRGTECLERIDCFAQAGAIGKRVRVAWSGISAYGNWQRARMRWDGELRIEGARILAVEGYAFDTPDEGLLEHGAAHVRWRSVTAGDWDGVVLDIDRPQDAELSFVTEPMTLRVKLCNVGPAGRRFDDRSPDRSVEVRRLPEGMPSLSYHGVFEDRSHADGEHAYWVRVRQSDGAFAWSSPIFVSVAQNQVDTASTTR